MEEVEGTGKETTDKAESGGTNIAVLQWSQWESYTLQSEKLDDVQLRIEIGSRHWAKDAQELARGRPAEQHAAHNAAPEAVQAAAAALSHWEGQEVPWVPGLQAGLGCYQVTLRQLKRGGEQAESHIEFYKLTLMKQLIQIIYNLYSLSNQENDVDRPLLLAFISQSVDEVSSQFERVRDISCLPARLLGLLVLYLQSTLFIWVDNDNGFKRRFHALNILPRHHTSLHSDLQPSVKVAIHIFHLKAACPLQWAQLHEGQ